MPTELVELPGGEFAMGSTSFYPEEAPIHLVTMAPFAIERYPVTNAQFAEFVDATGYVTVAERPLDPTLYPGVAQEDLLPGAHWRCPYGVGSDIADRLDHPVVQIAYPDAAAYAAWAGRRLPTEAEWEYAARAGSVTAYAWGDEPTVDGRLMANTWQGNFPYRNDGAQGVGTSRWVGSSPVGTFPPNDFGLFDMIGNVWEWTTTLYSERGHVVDAPPSSCCPIPAEPDPTVTQVLKGGSHLCAPEYCLRYRPSARSPQSQDSSSTHIGFRCVADLG